MARMEEQQDQPKADDEATDIRHNPAEEEDPGSSASTESPTDESPGEGKIHDL